MRGASESLSIVPRSPSCRGRPKRGWILIEKLNVYRLVHANGLGRTRKILAGKIFSLQAGLTIAGREHGCGTTVGCRRKFIPGKNVTWAANCLRMPSSAVVAREAVPL